MAAEFRLPDIGEGLIEVEIIEWLVPVGGSIAMDEVLVEVETDKATVELPSPFAGTVLHHGAQPGDILAVGEVLAVVGEPEEEWSPSVAPIVGTLSEEIEKLPTRSSEESGPREGRPLALPKVRKLAGDRGIDLTTVSGSGPAGRVEEADLLQGPEPVGRAESLGMRRRTIASRMTESWTTIPHVTAFDDVNVTALLERRRRLTAQLGRSVPLDALLAQAVISGLQTVPEMNASFRGAEVVYHDVINLGIAIDTLEGLTVPVVAGIETLALVEVIEQIETLAQAAHARSLTAAQLSGATFTMSNIGAVGGGYGTPIVPLGTAGILSFGRANDQPVALDGALAIAPVMPLSLSYDHRLIDGAVGRRFLAAIVAKLGSSA